MIISSVEIGQLIDRVGNYIRFEIDKSHQSWKRDKSEESIFEIWLEFFSCTYERPDFLRPVFH